MGSAPVRRASSTRLASSVRRGALVGMGTPGIYGVQRQRSGVGTIVAPLAPTEWITPPPVTDTLPLSFVSARLIGNVSTHPTTAPAASAYSVTLMDSPENDVSNSSLNAFLEMNLVGGTYTLQANQPASYFLPLDMMADATPPPTPDLPVGATGIETHPDDADLILVGAVNITGTHFAPGLVGAQLLLLPDGSDAGSRWQTPTDLATATVLATIAADASDTAIDVTVTPPTPTSTLIFLNVLDPFVTGEAWPEDATISSGAYDDGLTPARLVATFSYRGPRYRFTYPGVGLGTGSWTTGGGSSYYNWDAGLYLGGPFSDMTGFPTALPAGCAKLEFYVLPTGRTPSISGFPQGRYWIDSGGNGSSETATTPDAGSHLWVLWHGPDEYTGTDPLPPNNPSYYVPASLAADGTA